MRVILSFTLLCCSAIAVAQTTLKDVFKDSFLVGVSINRAQFSEEDPKATKIIKSQFNSVSPENVLKWASVHPQPGVYDFTSADRYVEFGEKHRMVIIGHTLVWHKQTSEWVFRDDRGNPVSREVLLGRMREHIQKVVGRYKGRIRGWDVVNEALDEDGSMRESPWMRIIGEDFVEKAFQYAHDADPGAELYYNDYSLENERKRSGALKLIQKLKADGIPITAVGLQGHDDLEFPSAKQQDEAIADFERLGVKVNITELDMTVLPRATKEGSADTTVNLASDAKLNPYVNGLPETVEQAQAKRYAELFAVFLKHRKSITRVTFWNVTDADSWRNRWPVPGRTDYPLLFDRKGAPKAAFDAVVQIGISEARH